MALKKSELYSSLWQSCDVQVGDGRFAAEPGQRGQQLVVGQGLVSEQVLQCVVHVAVSSESLCRASLRGVLTHNAVLHHSRLLSDERMQTLIDEAAYLVTRYLKS